MMEEDAVIAEELWLQFFFILAKHLPGLGGVQGFDEFTLEDVRKLLESLKDSFDQEAEAIRNARK